MAARLESCGTIYQPSNVRKSAIRAVEEYDGDLEQLANESFYVTFHAARRIITVTDVMMAAERIKNPPKNLFDELKARGVQGLA